MPPPLLAGITNLPAVFGNTFGAEVTIWMVYFFHNRYIYSLWTFFITDSTIYTNIRISFDLQQLKSGILLQAYQFEHIGDR